MVGDAGGTSFRKGKHEYRMFQFYFILGHFLFTCTILYISHLVPFYKVGKAAIIISSICRPGFWGSDEVILFP